jgi:hypothetical protein
MNKFFILPLILLSQILYSQNLGYRTTFFDTNNIANLELKIINLHNPNGGDDSTISNLKFRKINSIEYLIQILNYKKSEISIYTKELITNNPLHFKVVDNKITILTNLDTLKNKLKNNLTLKYGKDTTSFGDYYSWLYNPNIFIESNYMEYLHLFADIEGTIKKEGERTVLVRNMTDSIPAKESELISIDKNILTFNRTVTTDSSEAKKYLYNELIKKNGPDIVDVLKENDMVYVKTKIEMSTIGHKQSNDNSVLIDEIKYTKSINLGNPFDRINIIYISRK